MQTLTGDRPKPMLLLNGKPLLEHLLDGLRTAGFSDVLIVTGYHAEMIEQYFRSYPVNLQFRRQDPLDGTATAALLAEDFVDGDAFVLTFADILIDASCYIKILDSLLGDPKIEAVVAVKDVDDPYQGAAVYEEGGRVLRIIEKPPKGTSTTCWNSAGLFAFRPSIFEELRQVPRSSRGEFELTSALAQLLARGALVRIFPIEGFWRDIGRPEDLTATPAQSISPHTEKP
jgi:NDP-sugar pyrophosphorylase family protein